MGLYDSFDQFDKNHHGMAMVLILITVLQIMCLFMFNHYHGHRENWLIGWASFGTSIAMGWPLASVIDNLETSVGCLVCAIGGFILLAVIWLLNRNAKGSAFSLIIASIFASSTWFFISKNDLGDTALNFGIMMVALFATCIIYQIEEDRFLHPERQQFEESHRYQGQGER